MKPVQPISKARKVVHYALGTAAAVAIAAFFAIPSSPKMPSYNGRSAESWMREVARPSSSDAEEAFRNMGMDGYKYLLTTFARQPTSIERLYIRLHNRAPHTLQNLLPQPIYSANLVQDAFDAMTKVRDPNPEQSVPRLLRLMSSDDPSRRMQAAMLVFEYTFRYRKVDYAPFRSELMHALGDTNMEIRRLVIKSLHRAQLGRPDLIPRLQSALTNSDAQLRKDVERLLTQSSNAPGVMPTYKP